MSYVLVVDDHESIREPLAAYLRQEGFETSTAHDGASSRLRLSERRFDLIILDLMMPGEDGLSVCRHIRQNYGTPIIMLTAKVEFADRIAGLNLGADDYVTKPFNVGELVARVHSVLRRTSGSPRSINERPRRLTFEGWSLDLLHRRLSDPGQNEVALSCVEFRLLQAFLEHADTVLSREDLLALVDPDSEAFDRSIDSQVSRLRRKLEPDPRHPALLKTIWGSGYIFAAQVEAQAS
ncbi:response regulator transcription factor [Paraburkholderia sp. Ac-20347]|nr:response regulator transcription factor [Paraburkholderia sp. Ac-20347]